MKVLAPWWIEYADNEDEEFFIAFAWLVAKTKVSTQLTIFTLVMYLHSLLTIRIPILVTLESLDL